MTDPAADAAPSPAVTLAPELGPSLPTEVEARCPDAQHRPDRYLESPVVPRHLIVAIAMTSKTLLPRSILYLSSTSRVALAGVNA